MLREIEQGYGVRVKGKGKEVFLCLFSGLLLCLSYPNSNLEFLAWFGFLPLFIVLKNKSKLKAFLLAYFTGVIFWLGTVYWLIHVTGIGLVVLTLYLAIYFGVFGLIVRWMMKDDRLQMADCRWQIVDFRLLVLPAAWVVLEYIRSYLFTGFPWGLLGYSQYLNLPVIQIADITGVWGVSFLVMMVNVLIYSVMGDRLWVIVKKHFVPILCLLVTLMYGFYKINLEPNTKNLTPIKVAVIQGNIPQELKWDPQAKNFIINKYFELTRQAKEENPDLIVWPEASFPGFSGEEKALFGQLLRFVGDLQTPLLLGAVTSEGDLYYNSALFIPGRGELLSKYDKIHLVPFGEYIPLKMVFGFMENMVPIGSFSPGRTYTVFTHFLSKPMQPPGVKFSALICFEDLFPELSRKFVLRGAQFLVNITNDAWFQESSAPYQHLQASVFRAVENRVPLVRSANTGVSGFISANGKIVKFAREDLKNIFVDGFAAQNISLSGGKPTFYTRYGDVFVLVCFIYLIFGFLRKKKLRNA